MQHLAALLIGDSGIGKTTSIRTLPPKKTILAVGERGAVPLRDMAFPVLTFESWSDIQDIYRTLAGDADEKTAEVLAPCKHLVVDSLSEVNELCIKDIVTNARPELFKERTKGKADKPPGIYEDQMALEDWGLYKTRMLRLISAFAHLPMHVIMTCRAAWSKDTNDQVKYRTSGLNGRAALECPAYFDLVFYMRAAKDKEGNPIRVWQTFNDGEVVAKDSSGILNPYEEADWMKIFHKILGTKGGAA
jgi:hypothetical protein